jgi:hypothetical protein
MKKINITFLLLLSFLILPFLAFAQTESVANPVNNTISTSTKPTSGIFDCFEQYKFGSVKIESPGGTRNTRTGSNFSIPLIITNTNDYPIINGAVYIKVLKADDSISGFKKGPEVVEQKYLVKNLDLAAKQSKQVNFVWNVPLYLTSGKYTLASYFVANEKFNYAGLSFTNDIVGGLAEFNVTSENQNSVYLNKDNVKVNGENYDPASFSAKSPKDKPVKIQIEIVNTSKNTQRFPVTWYVYAWDGLSETNLILTKNSGAFLKAGEKKTLELLVTDNNYPVYYVTAIGEYNDTKSIINVRYALAGTTGVRINSASVSTYPLKVGEEAQVYACFHSMSDQTVPSTKLVVTLKDDKGETITENTYTGSTTPSVTGFRQVFTPTQDLYNFSVESKLFRDDKIVESETIKYVCNDIQTSGCSLEIVPMFKDFFSKLLTTPYVYIVYGLIIILLASLVLIIRRIRK